MNRPTEPPLTSRTYRRRLAAVLFADLVDYTRLAAQDEDAALELVQAFQDLAGEVVEGQDGRVVKRIGDAVMAEFPSTQAAVAAAFDLLEAYGAERRVTADLRIGVHLGEVTTAPDGDLYGDGVNVASRIHVCAQPGQVVVSEDVARHLRQRREFQLQPLGSRALKGLDEPVAVLEVRRVTASAPEARQTAGSGSFAQPAGDGSPLQPTGDRTPAQPSARRAGAPGTPHRSIAVLPFANLSADAENEYFSDGVTEEIVTALAKLEDLKVISRTSTMQYKGVSRDLRGISRELNVATVLEGSVRRAGNRVRITAQLIDGATDQHLWAERYDRDLEDIFAIQTDVADRIVDALRVRLSPRERSRLCCRPTDSVEAYEKYLKGIWHLIRKVPEHARAAAECFENAIEIDPAFAAAHAGLAMAEVFRAMWDATSTYESLARGRWAARRALELDSDLAEAHAAQAQIHLYDYDWAGADREFRLALELNPGAAGVRHLYSFYLGAMGRLDEAFAQVARAKELDPLSLAVLTGEGDICLLARRYDDAIRIFKRVLEMDPTYHAARYPLANIYFLTGRHAEALALWEAVGIITAEDVVGARKELEKGRLEYMEGLIQLAPQRGAPPSWIASACAQVGRFDEAFEWLERAYQGHDFLLVALAVGPMYDPLRGDPRYQAMVERLGLDKVVRPGAVPSSPPA